jgi:acetyl-CoA acetyltransferase
MTLRDKAAVVGVGSTPYYKRGRSLPQTPFELAGKAVLAAVEDAGLTIADVDGLALYSMGLGGDTSLFAQTLGIPEVRFTATLTGGGGGAAGSVGLAAAAIASGMAECVVSLMTLQQAVSRFGASYAPRGKPGAQYSAPPSPEGNFIQPAGLMGPGQMFAVLATRHMHLYGTKREHMAEVAISTRENARRRETSLMRDPLTLDDYFAARMIAEPLCLFDFCLECDGAVAVVTTTAERAKDLRHPPAYVRASAHGGNGRWGQAIVWMGMPDDEFASSGHRPVAKRMYEMAGLGPSDVDVALLYDHFSPMVLLQLEDYGFCGIGEAGPFVESGAIRWPSGALPVNTHGGNLSEAYIIGMTHVREAVEQIRGTAVNQVEGCEVALATGGPASIPVSGLLLTKETDG